jgi:hypothetical protein
MLSSMHDTGLLVQQPQILTIGRHFLMSFIYYTRHKSFLMTFCAMPNILVCLSVKVSIWFRIFNECTKACFCHFYAEIKINVENSFIADIVSDLPEPECGSEDTWNLHFSTILVAPLLEGNCKGKTPPLVAPAPTLLPLSIHSGG